jgi:hypothetical protein
MTSRPLIAFVITVGLATSACGRSERKSTNVLTSDAAAARQLALPDASNTIRARPARPIVRPDITITDAEGRDTPPSDAGDGAAGPGAGGGGGGMTLLATPKSVQNIVDCAIGFIPRPEIVERFETIAACFDAVLVQEDLAESAKCAVSAAALAGVEYAPAVEFAIDMYECGAAVASGVDEFMAYVFDEAGWNEEIPRVPLTTFGATVWQTGYFFPASSDRALQFRIAEGDGTVEQKFMVTVHAFATTPKGRVFNETKIDEIRMLERGECRHIGYGELDASWSCYRTNTNLVWDEEGLAKRGDECRLSWEDETGEFDKAYWESGDCDAR